MTDGNSTQTPPAKPRVPTVTIAESFPVMDAALVAVPGGIDAEIHGDGILVTMGTASEAHSALLPPDQAERLAQRLLSLVATTQKRSAASAAQAVEASRG